MDIKYNNKQNVGFRFASNEPFLLKQCYRTKISFLDWESHNQVTTCDLSRSCMSHTLCPPTINYRRNYLQTSWNVPSVTNIGIRKDLGIIDMLVRKGTS